MSTSRKSNGVKRVEAPRKADSLNPFAIKQDLQSFQETIAQGAIVVSCHVRAPSLNSKTEVIDLQVVVPSKWSTELQRRLEECIDQFGEEMGVGKLRTTNEGTII